MIGHPPISGERKRGWRMANRPSRHALSRETEYRTARARQVVARQREIALKAGNELAPIAAALLKTFECTLAILEEVAQRRRAAEFSIDVPNGVAAVDASMPTGYLGNG